MFNASKSRSKVRSFSHALAIVPIHLFPLALLVLRVLGAIAEKCMSAIILYYSELCSSYQCNLTR